MSTLEKSFSGLVYVGRRTMRAEDEPSIKDLEDGKEQLKREYPEAYPHIFIEYNGLGFGELLTKPSRSFKGASGLLAGRYQPMVRNQGGDGATPAEVEAWREGFEPEMLEGQDIVDLSNGKVEEFDPIGNVMENIVQHGDPFVILDADNIDLDVPKQPKDMLAVIRDFEEKHDVELLGETPNDAEIRTMFNAMENQFGK